VSSKNGTKIGTDNLVGDLGGDIAETREILGDQAEALAEKADVKTRTRDAVRAAAVQTREGGQQAVERVDGSVRRHPAWWASFGAGVVAAAAAAGALRWRQARRTPRSRAARAWHGVTDRFGR
jgi:ElaB/YqjD/DUF883 family membrane-anchored ribosome-binding protein